MRVLTTVFILVPAAACAASFSLDEAVVRALETDEGYSAARFAVEAASGGVEAARGAYFPTLTLDAAVVKTVGVPERTIDIPLGLPVEFSVPMGFEEQITAGATISQTLWAGGRITGAYRSAKERLRLAAADESLARAEVIYATKRAYYDLILAREVAAAEEASLENAQSHLAATEKRLAAGLVSRYETMRAEVEVVNVSAAVDDAYARVRAAELSLAARLNLPLDEPLDLTDGFAADRYPPDLETALATSADRPELEKMTAEIKANERSIELARAADNPSLGVSARFEEYALDFTGDPDLWDEKWTFTLGFSWPLFDGLATRGRVRSARAALDALRETETATAEAVELEVHVAYENALAAGKSARAGAENVALAEEALKIAETGYAAGTMSYLELLDARNALTTARLGYATALYNYNVALLDLERASGTLVGKY
ncbi:MAG: TolC family protein [Candidatus Coatesbacteria bacterium]|nr:MAG: TolC family protein [Candidatus Coatesbacteria bacterium]